jgi:ribosomal protein S18 acetylase RimI-like enzyme
VGQGGARSRLAGRLIRLKVRIVPIAESHIASFRVVIDRVAREKRYLAMLEAPSLADTRKFVRRNIKSGNPQFVAVANGKVVGWCDIVRGARDTMAHSGVLGLGLIPEFRGQGIGRRLLRSAIEGAWRRKFTRIELTVREDNANAIALYCELGFEAEGVRRNAFRIDGEYTNLISMALLKEERAHAPASPEL